MSEYKPYMGIDLGARDIDGYVILGPGAQEFVDQMRAWIEQRVAQKIVESLAEDLAKDVMHGRGDGVPAGILQGKPIYETAGDDYPVSFFTTVTQKPQKQKSLPAYRKLEVRR